MINKSTSRTLCFVCSSKVELLSGDDVKKEEVGAKAFGLSAVPTAWTLPFFVISSEMFEEYLSKRDVVKIKNSWRSKVIEAAYLVNIDLTQPIYIRSNNSAEMMSERGKFESHECDSETFFDTVAKYYETMITEHQYTRGVPILVQQCVQVLGQGHISNERRLSKEHRDWKGEIEQRACSGIITGSPNVFSISLRNWRRNIAVDYNNAMPLRCSSLDNISQTLEFPCFWASNKQVRIHFEWIFDGTTVYIVQADEEQDYGINPRKRAKSAYHAQRTTFAPKVLQVLSSEDKLEYELYSKVRNPLIYKELGLKIAPIYLLRDPHELNKLSMGEVSEQLREDLSVLASNPLVIRVDIETNDQSLRQMLPRTDDIRNLEDAIKWLIENSKILFDRYGNKIPFIFILHNFIPAFSSAFAYAEPNNRNALVESLWGLPEGLYYYAHDKYIIDTRKRDFSSVSISEFVIQQKKVNAKNNFVFPYSDGKWSCAQVAPDYIWRQAIPKEAWLKEIAYYTRKIAEHVGKGISVMWFVGVDPNVYNCNVFPWHHEPFTYTAVPKQTNRKKNQFESTYTISRNADTETLKKVITLGNRENIKYLKFKPIEESMIRDKDLIEKVGVLAKQIDAVIILEGGMLSHAYYQLIRTGAAVEVSNNFDSTLLNADFDKLVRDKIPDKITKGGELVLTKKLSQDEFLEQLRIKLVEEALEVLEAKSDDELVQELADVLEVIESIMRKKRIPRKMVVAAQSQKREKVGGFEEGIILQKTALPLLYNTVKSLDESIQKENEISFWADKKEKTGYSETIRRLKIPISLKHWDTHITAKGSNSRPDIYVSLKGKRAVGTLQIEITVNEGFEQLTLFDD